ncbi:uncharacterized protein LOC144472181 [Augochlora pura]
MKMFRENGGKFVVFALVILTFVCGETFSECNKITNCSCAFPDGLGYDLTQLNGSRPLITRDNKNYTFYFHPCENIPLTTNESSECFKGKGVSMCLVNENNHSSISLGTVEETTMIVYPEKSKKQSSLFLQHTNYNTTVEFVCCKDCVTRLVADETMNIQEHHLLLVSPHVCELQVLEVHKFSIGSILVFIFFSLCGVYFIGGALTLNLLRGATGLEMIPNHGFWKDLPSLVREGINSTLCCCRASSYLEI